MRKLWHKTDDKDWHEVELHATDAAHALRVDPEHWATEKPVDLMASDMADEDDSGDIE